MHLAIEVDQLSKRYQLGANASAGLDLRETLVRAATAPWRRFRKARVPESSQPDDGEFWALRDVSFGIRDGEVLGVIGRNGAGKSTLLKILSRIAEPTSGRVTIRGRVSSLLEVGTGFHLELSGRENIYLNGAILGMSRREIDRKLDEIVDFSGVEKFLDTPVKRYSSGMRVRLGFAVAAHLEPDILIIDEVLAVGDVGFQRKCLGKMDRIAKSGRTILFVSHNMAAIRAHCSRGLLLERGAVAAYDAIDAVVDQYNALQAETVTTRRESVPGDAGYGEDHVLHLGPASGCYSIKCGDPLQVNCDVEFPVMQEEVTAGITVFTHSGEPVVGMSSKVQAVPSAIGPARRWNIRADLGRIPLNAGYYVLRVYIGDGQRDVARFSNAINLEVQENDVFGWGNALPPVSSWGNMYHAPKWQLSPADRDAAALDIDLEPRKMENV